MKILFALILALGLPAVVRAGLPLPDHVLYGTVAFTNGPATLARTDVVIEARRAPNQPVIASYRMGTAPRLGDFFYELRFVVEDSTPSSAGVVQAGEELIVTVRDATGPKYTVRHRVPEPGAALRLDFGGSLDTDGDGVPEAWARAQLGSAAGDLNRDTDGDGATDRAEYEAGTSPMNRTEVFRLATTLEAGEVRVSFRALSAQGVGYDGRSRFYALDVTTNLFNGAWQPVSNFSRIPGRDQMVVHAEPDSGTNPPAFFRARVWLEQP
jgi:hypothetical protein